MNVQQDLLIYSIAVNILQQVKFNLSLAFTLCMWTSKDTFSQGQSKSWPQVYGWYELIAGVSFQGVPLHQGISTSCIDLGEEVALCRSFTECITELHVQKLFQYCIFFTYIQKLVHLWFWKKYPLEWIFRWRPMVWFCVCVNWKDAHNYDLCSILIFWLCSIWYWYYSWYYFRLLFIFLVLFTENMAFNVLLLFFICVCVPQSPEEDLTLLELELQAIISQHVGAGIELRPSARTAHVPNCWANSLLFF